MQLGNYDMMLLTETNILDEEYCHNHLGYNVVCYQALGTVDGGAQGVLGLVVR